jgi:hypothetical protein
MSPAGQLTAHYRFGALPSGPNGSCAACRACLGCPAGRARWGKAVMADGSRLAPKLISQERRPGRNFDLYDTGSATEIFVDGMTQALLGPAICRLDFHKVVKSEALPDSSEQLETRELHLRVVIPTLQMVEFLVSTLAGVKSNQAGIFEALNAQRQGLQTLLDRMTDVPSP